MLQHWVHEQDQLYIRDTKPSSFPCGNQHPETPPPQERGRESKAQPRSPARCMPSLPPCTATGSQFLRGFFVLDNKNKTLLSGSYKNPTEKLSPVPSGVLEKSFCLAGLQHSQGLQDCKVQVQPPSPPRAVLHQGIQQGAGGEEE